MVKLIRRVVPGIHPEAEVTRYLTKVGFANTAPLLGEIVRMSGDGTPHTLAIAQGVIANQGDAWTWVLDGLKRAVEDTVLTEQAEAADFQSIRFFIATIGRRLGELHKALAQPTDDPAFAPVEAGQDAVENWKVGVRAQVMGALDALEAQLGTLDAGDKPEVETLLGEREALLGLVDRLARQGLGTLLTRVHGDFHLGQVLVSQDDAYLIDFEGEPARPLEERRAKASPLRDVAGMMRSIDYAVASVRRPDEDASAQPVRERRRSLLREFRRSATDSFLESYREAAGTDPTASPGQGDGSLLDLMLIEKAAYEVSYEMANRPHWVMIPLRGLLNIVERLTGREGRA